MRNRYLFFVLFTFLFGFISQCSNPVEEKKTVKENIPAKGKSIKKTSRFGALPEVVQAPADNPLSLLKAELGRLLFYDPILSGDKDIACVSCHHPNHGYAEYLDLSIGTNGKGLSSKRTFNHPNTIPLMKRNSPTILNTAFNGIDSTNVYTPGNAPMFWDLRVANLEKQALEPMLTLEEMRGPHFAKTEILAEIVRRLKNIPEYLALFQAAFDEPDPINDANIGKAIAAFERTLVTSNTRFDQYMKGDKNAISLSEKDGFEMFIEVGCAECHKGPMLSDFKSHVIGVPQNKKLSEFDKGIDDEYAFRTPSLRNLRYTAPYMHNGRFNTLKEVLEFYEDIAEGQGRHQEVSLGEVDPLIHRIDLTVKEIGPIISFLNTLNDPNFDKRIPESVPSGLPVGGNIHE